MADFLPDSLSELSITVIGLGLMGGSFALSLREHCREIHGIDPNSEVRDLAAQMMLCRSLGEGPEEIAEGTQLVVLAAPLTANLRLLETLGRQRKEPIAILDLSSTKGDILAAMDALPPHFDPIGGHPMCGKERSSLREAERGLFRNAVFAVSPLPRTSAKLRSLAAQIVEKLEARLMLVNPAAHDRWAAATSHVPYITANALAATTPLEAAHLVGPGYRSTTRVAVTPESMMQEVLESNRGNIRQGLRRLIQRLEAIDRALESGSAADLRRLLATGRQHQEQLLLAADE